MRYIVLGESDDIGVYAIGPVYNETTVEKVRDAIRERDDILRGSVPLTSWNTFKAEGPEGGEE